MLTPESSRVRWRVAAAMAFVIASIVLLAPGSAMSAPTWNVPHADKFVHATIFLVLGLLAGKSVHPRARHLVFLGVVAYGALTEGLQHYIPGRSSDLRDLAANVAGAALGVVLSQWTSFKRGKS